MNIKSFGLVIRFSVFVFARTFIEKTCTTNVKPTNVKVRIFRKLYFIHSYQRFKVRFSRRQSEPCLVWWSEYLTFFLKIAGLKLVRADSSQCKFIIFFYLFYMMDHIVKRITKTILSSFFIKIISNLKEIYLDTCSIFTL